MYGWGGAFCQRSSFLAVMVQVGIGAFQRFWRKIITLLITIWVAPLVADRHRRNSTTCKILGKSDIIAVNFEPIMQFQNPSGFRFTYEIVKYSVFCHLSQLLPYRGRGGVQEDHHLLSEGSHPRKNGFLLATLACEGENKYFFNGFPSISPCLINILHL